MCHVIMNKISLFLLKIDQYIGQYLDFTDILVLAKTADFVGLSNS